MTSGSMLMGIIPAYAGSTITRLLFTLRFSDHPRIRGEHPVVLDAGVGDRGSSPHTRGARPLVSAALPPVRIIPAYAGSTTSSRARAAGRGDHPRIRGEHAAAAVPEMEVPGSSPHTRGAHIPAVEDSGVEGIIPAYAGSTCRRILGSAPGTDHPRIRGEHFSRSTVNAMSAGSSPHTRGARPAPTDRNRNRRIIPAYAGSTPWTRPPRYSRADHPRIRGEHPVADAGREAGKGIIPAYAGSTADVRGPGSPTRDHPRIRGEHWRYFGWLLGGMGSSPHTRGARW